MTITSTEFGNHLLKMLSIVIEKINEDVELIFFKNSVEMFKKNNPKLLVRMFYNAVTVKYKNQILSGDIEFFMNKDYQEDIKKSLENQTVKNINSNASEEKIVNYINYLREIITSKFSYQEQLDIVLYFQQLVKMSIYIIEK